MDTISRQTIEYIWVIDSGFAYAGLIVVGGRCTETAPIYSNTFLGHSTAAIKWICMKSGWSIVEIIRRRVSPDAAS